MCHWLMQGPVKVRLHRTCSSLALYYGLISTKQDVLGDGISANRLGMHMWPGERSLGVDRATAVKGRGRKCVKGHLFACRWAVASSAHDGGRVKSRRQ
jgi:hypothetical protein